MAPVVWVRYARVKVPPDASHVIRWTSSTATPSHPMSSSASRAWTSWTSLVTDADVVTTCVSDSEAQSMDTFWISLTNGSEAYSTRYLSTSSPPSAARGEEGRARGGLRG